MDGLVTAVPVPPSALIGRAGELVAARALLATARVVTLVGPGGAGKTRLAFDVAAAHDGDVVFVDLGPLDDPARVLSAIALAVGLRDGGARPLSETLRTHLRDRRLLVLLDNVEHVLEAGPDVAGLLAACAAVQILATSRASLQIPGEHLVAVDPLPVPDPRDLPSPDALTDISSVALFVERVRAACPGFALTGATARTVAEICVALDGLPLALELAAAQVRAFGLDEVLVRTRSRFTLLDRPGWAVPERHRSLEGVVRGSVDRLDPEVRALFGRLSVFSGGWTAAAADGGCGPARGLDQLVDQSLVAADDSGGGVRYRMLETLRVWAAGVLKQGEDGPEARSRHTAWVAALAAQVGAGFCGPEEARQLDRAETEHANIRTSLERLPPGDPTGLRIATDLSWFWDVRGHLREGRAHLERLLAAPTAEPALRSGALDALGRLATYQSDHAAADTALRESVRLSLDRDDHPAAAWSLSTLSMSASFTGRDTDAAAFAERAVTLARPGGGTPLGRSLAALFIVRTLQGRHADAAETFTDTLATLGEDEFPPPTWARARTLY